MSRLQNAEILKVIRNRHMSWTKYVFVQVKKNLLIGDSRKPSKIPVFSHRFDGILNDKTSIRFVI